MARARRRSDIVGDGLTALCAGALAANLVLVVALLVVLALNGLGHFWQGRVVELDLRAGERMLGEVRERESIPHGAPGAGAYRLRLEVGNRDVSGADFVWIDEDEIASREHPEDAVLLERLEYGNFYGYIVGLRRGEEVLAQGPSESWEALKPLERAKQAQARAIRRLERGEIGDVNRRIEELRLAERRLERAHPPDLAVRLAELGEQRTRADSEYEALSRRLADLREEWEAEQLVLRTAAGEEHILPVAHVVRALRPNTMGVLAKLGLYGDRLWEFLSASPRESNTEGGIFPAIFGTVMMVFLMSFMVAPFGVLGALYLREYSREGLFVRIVRIAVNNLAGVPSIVFGVFGLGFFVYLVGGAIDRVFHPDALPTPTFGTGGILWASLTLALLTVPVVIVATEEGLAAVPRVVREGSLALGATKLETTWRVVLPAAAPGILTGLILAMARAAGEVAPLMIVGMVKLAPALPFDAQFPFVHLERKFMHLGFHIYDVGFQSPNVEATKPLVFATALLLILVVTAMNVVAITLRNHLRRKYAGSAV